MFDKARLKVTGHVFIHDLDTGEILLDKYNAINWENMSIAIAKAMSSSPEGHIHEMHFGSGGSIVNDTGIITYFTPNVSSIDADLYNPTYYKVVDDKNPLNSDPVRNSTVVKHVVGTTYTDIVVKCTLDYDEPKGQQAFDDAVNSEGDFIFNEIGLKTFNVVPGAGSLISHVVFNPIQKSLNRRIEILYTIRYELA